MLHDFTGFLGTRAWAGVYVTQEYFHTNEYTRCRVCTYVYMCKCVCTHAYTYGCVCASMIFLSTLTRYARSSRVYHAPVLRRQSPHRAVMDVTEPTCALCFKGKLVIFEG